MFDKWLAEEGERVLQSFFETVASKVNLEPELPFEDVPAGPARDRAQALWSKVQPAQAEKIKAVEEEAYRAEINKLPEYVRAGMNESTRKAFRVQEYYNIVEQILSKDSLAQNSTSIV